MEIISLSSGSSGNCILIECDGTYILVDVGISAKSVETKLEEIGINGTDISAILVTHEHKDHISGLKLFASRYGMPVYASYGTVEALLESMGDNSIPQGFIIPISPDMNFKIGNLNIMPFRVSHDAKEPVSYRIDTPHASCAVVTDIGTYDDDTINKLLGLNAIYIEANHDENILSVGAYPYFLKERILSDEGHLSNNNCGRLLSKIYSPLLKNIMLGHLSKNNNFPELAYETVRSELLLSCDGYYLEESSIKIASEDMVCRMSF